RPDDEERPAYDLALGDGAAARVIRVVARVLGVAAVVAHDPHVPGRDDVAELDRRGPLAGVHVLALVQRHAVDGDPALGITAGHTVPGQADHPFDVVGLVGVQAEPGQHVVEDPHHRVAGRRRRVRTPRVLPAEHDDVAAGHAAEVI